MLQGSSSSHRGWVQPYRAHHFISIHHNSFYGARVRGRRQTAQIQAPFKTIPQSTGISLHAFSCVFFVYNALSLRPTKGGSIKEASTMSQKLHNLRLLLSVQKWEFRPNPGKPKQQEDRFELCNLLFFLPHVILGHLLFYKAVKIRMHSRERVNASSQHR